MSGCLLVLVLVRLIIDDRSLSFRQLLKVLLKDGVGDTGSERLVIVGYFPAQSVEVDGNKNVFFGTTFARRIAAGRGITTTTAIAAAAAFEPATNNSAPAYKRALDDFLQTEKGGGNSQRAGISLHGGEEAGADGSQLARIMDHQRRGNGGGFRKR